MAVRLEVMVVLVIVVCDWPMFIFLLSWRFLNDSTRVVVFAQTAAVGGAWLEECGSGTGKVSCGDE